MSVRHRAMCSLYCSVSATNMKSTESSCFWSNQKLSIKTIRCENPDFTTSEADLCCFGNSNVLEA